MEIADTFYSWETDEFFDTALRREISTLDPVITAAKIENHFYYELEFGTGGLRGIMEAGTNLMNKYIIGKTAKVSEIT